jgi:hypothetical protein
LPGVILPGVKPELQSPAYRLGAQDQVDGLPRSANPFAFWNHQRVAAQDWDAGWEDRCLEAIAEANAAIYGNAPFSMKLADEPQRTPLNALYLRMRADLYYGIKVG